MACDGCVLTTNHSSSLGTSDTGSMNVLFLLLLLSASEAEEEADPNAMA